MLDFLSEFYDNRRTPVSQRLVLSFYGHSARLINQGEGVQDSCTKEDQLVHLHQFRKEMREFTEFLKNRFFSR